MGFFDFLNRQGEHGPDGAFQRLSASAQTSTRIVQQLLEVPKPDRNRAWSDQFLAQLADAAFYTRYPSVVLGAGLPYFALHSTGEEGAFPTHVIHHMKDDFLLDRGLGVVINPSGQEADWALSYGDILHFHLHGDFYPAPADAAPGLGLPPQDRLPQPARHAIRAFLQGLGVAAPRVMLAAWDHAGPGSLELVFDFTPKDFASLDDFRLAMGNLSWFLPRNYSYSVAGSQARKNIAFEPL